MTQCSRHGGLFAFRGRGRGWARRPNGSNLFPMSTSDTHKRTRTTMYTFWLRDSLGRKRWVSLGILVRFSYNNNHWRQQILTVSSVKRNWTASDRRVGSTEKCCLSTVFAIVVHELRFGHSTFSIPFCAFQQRFWVFYGRLSIWNNGTKATNHVHVLWEEWQETGIVGRWCRTTAVMSPIWSSYFSTWVQKTLSKNTWTKSRKKAMSIRNF